MTFSRHMAALADLSISFLPVFVMLLIVPSQISAPRPDMSFLVAALFTEGAWRARNFPTIRPTEKWSAILIGVLGGMATILAATMLTFAEMNMFQEQVKLATQSRAMWISFYGYLIAIPYAWYVRYKCP